MSTQFGEQCRLMMGCDVLVLLRFDDKRHSGMLFQTDSDLKLDG